MSNIAFVRRPAPRLAEGLTTHIERQPVDVSLALRQWDDYVDELMAHAWEIVEAPPADDCPDSVFIEDTAVIFAGEAIITSPGAPERRAEIHGVEETLTTHGLTIHRIEPSARLDGGDVLKIGSTMYVGRGGRTNEAGIASMRSIVEPLGGHVVAVPISRVLHLKSAVTALPDGTVIGWDPLVDDLSAFETYLSVPEELGAHVVILDPETVLMSARAPRTADILRQRGLQVVPVDISEFEKLEGCVTCLSVRLRS